MRGSTTPSIPSVVREHDRRIRVDPAGLRLGRDHLDSRLPPGRRMSDTRLRIEEELAQVERDIAEVAEQLASGELDEATAQRLRRTYDLEADRLHRLLDEDGEEQVSATPTRGRSMRRTMIGAIVLVLAAAVVVAVGVKSLTDRSGQDPTAGLAADALQNGEVDLSNVTNEQMEQVVAENPDIVPMRLALARRYFEAGEFDKAFDHYWYILNDLGVESAEALANVGWMTALSGEYDVAESLLERAIEVQPDYAQAFWFLGNVRSEVGDHCGAADALDTVVAAPGVPDDIRQQADALRMEERASCTG